MNLDLETIQRIDMFLLSYKNTESNVCLLLLKEGRRVRRILQYQTQRRVRKKDI